MTGFEKPLRPRVGQGNKIELWDEEAWTQRRDEWLAEEGDYSNLPQELETFYF
jgi:MraZ protein